MKNVIILAVIAVAGYFAYQYFIGSSPQSSAPRGSTFNMYSLPEECQSAGESLQEAIASNKSNVSINGFTQNFRRCLRNAGYTDSQIDEAYDGIRGGR